MTNRHRILVVLAFLALAGACLAEAQVDPLAARATAYARAFFAGDDLTAYHDSTMNRVMTPEAAGNARTQLAGSLGAFESAGEARFEDTLQGYRRYRVPLGFEGGTRDLRVVFNGEDLVAGVFVVAPEETPEPAPVDEVDVRVGDAATGLPGTLSLPGGDRPSPGIVLVHGSGTMDRDETVGPNKPFRDLAWGLAQRGIAVLRYDKRSHARMQDLVAQGYDLTVEHESVNDAVEALRVLRERPEVDSERVFLLGHSQGGTVAPRIAARAGDLAGLVILAGATRPLPEKVAEQIRYLASLDGEITPEEEASFARTDSVVTALRRSLASDEADDTGIYFGAPVGYWKDMESHDPPTELRGLGLPAFILQGGRDYQVTEADFEGWREVLGDERSVCFRLYPDLDHLFRPGEGPSAPSDYERPVPLDARVVSDIADWILTRACPEP